MRLFLSEHTTDNKTNDYGAFPSLDNVTAERDEKANVDRWGENEGICLGRGKKEDTPGGGLRFICFSTSFCSSFSFSASSSISLTRALIASSSCSTDTDFIRAVSPSCAQLNTISQCQLLLDPSSPTSKSKMI